MTNPMELDAALRTAVDLTYKYHAMVAKNYSRTDVGWPPIYRTAEQAQLAETLGMEQHRLHMQLWEARTRLNTLLATPASESTESAARLHQEKP